MDQQEVNELEASYRELSKGSFLVFARGLKIPAAGGPALFDSVMAPFQREFFESVAPSLHAVRNGTMPPCRRFWLERTKKASKDLDAAVCLLWLMAFSERPLLGQVCAANSKQAAIIEDRARTLLYYNPWLNGRVEVVERMIRSKRRPRVVKVQIEATGSAGAAQGPTPDVLVLNELVHVEKWNVMKAHVNNAAGVPQGIMIVATNAGIKGTPAEVWRNSALESDRWKVQIWNGKAPWISKEDMEDAKEQDPVGAEYARLWEGRWVSGVGSAVDEASIDRCFRAAGPHETAMQGWQYTAGLDLGVSHDHSGIAVVGVCRAEQRLAVATVEGYVPTLPNDKGVLEVDCDRVEQDCFDLWQTFRIESFWYDPAAGGSFMAQRLRRRGVPMREMTFSSSTNLTRMAKAFVTSVKDGKLECYEDPEGRLRRDFGKFDIEHRPPSNYKLISVSDEHGHADVGTALVICLPRAIELLDRWDSLAEGDSITFEDEDEEELSEQDVTEMPDELREIYEME